MACNSKASPWINWSGTQEFFPCKVERPTSLRELQQIVRTVSERGGRMKAVATGLSFSDILRSDDTLVEVTALLGEGEAGVLLPLEEELWGHPHPAAPHVRIVCGARIRQLNAALARAGLAFTNLGGYDTQTMVGAISTSTHGSGITLGPLANQVRSLDLVTTGGALWRLEPTQGLTNPDKFHARYGDSMQLLQDDATFWSVVVSMGCMGVIYSVVMEVSPAFCLTERRRMRKWRDVSRELRQRDTPLDQFRNYEILINPYPTRDNDHTCLVTEREVAPRDARRRPLSSGYRNDEAVTFLASSQTAIVDLMLQQPRLIPGLLEAGMGALVSDETVDDSFKVYNVGKINTAYVVAGEYFFPIKDHAYLDAIERQLCIMAENQKKHIYQTSPIAVRFVAASKAPLSMARDEPHCAIELSLFAKMPYACDALRIYEQDCLDHGGRPHWGQFHTLTGQSGWLRKAYQNTLDVWLNAYEKRFNTAGIFNNHFTDRLRISMPMQARP